MCAAVAPNGVLQVSPSLMETTRKDPRSLTNLNDILSCLSSFQSEEAELSNSLTELLSAREPIVASLSRLQFLAPHLDELHLQASLLSEKVSSTAQTADRVGGKVRSLDEEMRRVRESAERVGQVMELKVICLYIGLDENVIPHATLYSYHWHLFSLLLIIRIGNLPRDIVLGLCHCPWKSSRVRLPRALLFVHILHLSRTLFSIVCKAYIRESSATCPDTTGCARTAPVNIPTSFRSSVS
jgi:hypothetical protein